MPQLPTAPTPTALEDTKTSHGRSTVVVLAASGIVVSLMQSLLIPLIPDLPRLLNASSSDTAWAVTATLLAGAVATPTVGRLGDMFGKRRMLLVSIALLVAGSVIGALSSSLVPLVVGRALQGLSAGVIPLGISIMRDELPAERLGSATATMSASLGVGGALGLPLAAVIAQSADWHVLFWVSAALGLLAFILVRVIVPESSVRGGGRFDFVGAAGISVFLVCLLLAVSKGADWGWNSPLTIGTFLTAGIALVLWGVWELRATSPLVDLRVTGSRQLLLTNSASMIFGFAMFAMSLALPQLLQAPAATGYGLEQPLLIVGLVMAPSGLVMMAVAPISARITRSAGPRTALIVGAAVTAAGYATGVFLMSAVWQIVLVSVLIGAGVGIAYGAMPALVMSATPASQTAAANSFNTLMRSIGTSVSSAVAGVVLAQLTTSVGGTAVPTQAAFQTVLAISAAAALLALVMASFIPRNSRTV